MNYTTIEQSKELVEAGLDPNSADMHIIDWRTEKEGYYDTSLCYSKWDAEHVRGYFPCWSIGALIELMPDTLSIGTRTYCLWINSNSCGYYIMKENLPASGDCLCSYFKYNGSNPIYDCFKYLLENNYIKKGGTK
jgi:hypothetical protein